MRKGVIMKAVVWSSDVMRTLASQESAEKVPFQVRRSEMKW